MISVVIPVFRDAKNAVALIESLLSQTIPDDCTLEIIMVDDGSNDGTTETLRICEGERVHLLTLPQNVGRAVACNMGARLAGGQFLFFIDCDCRPANQNFISSHIQILRGDCIASCGPIYGNGNDFWSRYQNDASARRTRQHSRGITYAGSTANFAVLRSNFLREDGFDPRYRKYGFEDRDLLVRLTRRGKIGWNDSSGIRHLDTLNLEKVLTKMQIAAGESANRFANDHAIPYEALGFASIDTRLHHWLRPICYALKPALKAAPAIDSVLRKNLFPYAISRTVIRSMAALAYMVGSAEDS